MKRPLWIALGLVAAVSLVVAGWSFRSAQRARAAEAELARDRRALDTESAQLHRQLAARREEMERLSTALREDRTPPGTPSPAPAAPASAAPRRELADLLQADPALRALFRQSTRAELAMRFRPLYLHAQLSPAQIEKFEELMTDAEQGRLDLQAAAKAQGLAANDPALAGLRRSAADELARAQRETLGEEGFQVLQRVDRQEGMVQLLTQVARLAPVEQPLTPTQYQQLLDRFTQASSRYQKGGPVVISELDPEQVTQLSRQVLTPEQFAAMRTQTTHLELQRFMTQFYREKKAAAK